MFVAWAGERERGREGEEIERATSSRYERHVSGVGWVGSCGTQRSTPATSVSPQTKRVVYLSYDPAPESVSAASIYSFLVSSSFFSFSFRALISKSLACGLSLYISLPFSFFKFPPFLLQWIQTSLY